MPLYEYQCEKCKHQFERIQKFSDPPVKKCPQCGGPVHQLLSAPAVQFKGSGWYVTDYARKGAPPAESAKAESSDDGSPAKSSDKTDKPDSKKSEKKTTKKH